MERLPGLSHRIDDIKGLVTGPRIAVSSSRSWLPATRVFPIIDLQPPGVRSIAWAK